MKEERLASSVKKVLVVFTLLFCLVFVSAPLLADISEPFAHPGYYTTIKEETLKGDSIVLDNTELSSLVDFRSIIRIVFDEEKLSEVVKALNRQGKKVSIRIEAFIKPDNAEKYPITVPGYSTVVRTTEVAQEAALPESEKTKITSFTKVEYEIYYHDQEPTLTPAETEAAIATLPDTHLEIASLSLNKGDRVYVTVSDIENHYRLSKVLEVKSFGLEVYFTSPILLALRQSVDQKVSLAPSPGTTIVFKMTGRSASLLEDWLHFGLSIAFLNFDERQPLEVGLAVALTVYKDFVEIGYGRNLMVGENPWYWYIGLNVVKLPTARSS